MTPKPFLALCAGLPLAIAAAAEALPPILDRVPEDSMVVVSVPSVQDLDKDVQALTAAAKLPVPGMMGIQQMLAAQGLDQVLDTTRPAAVFIRNWEDVETEPPFVALIPVKDYQAMVEMFGAVEQDGIHAMRPGGEGPKLFSRQLEGGYAAIGPVLEHVQAYQGEAGNADAHKATLGPVAEKVVDESNIAFIVNAEEARPLIEQFITVMQEQMAMEMGMPGMQMPESPAADWLRETISRDAQVYVSGISAGATGASVDAVVRFTPDSYMAKVVSGAGKAPTYLSRLPKQQFLIAFAVDASATPAMRQFLKDFTSKAKEDAAQVAPNLFMEQVERINGFSYMIGAPVALMVPGGLFANTVAYTATDDPAAYIDGVQEALTAMNGLTTEGLVYETEWQADAAAVDDVSAAGWTMRISDDGTGTNPMAQQLQMFFGPAGLTGYIAPAEGGVVQTYARNSMLLETALEAAKAGKEGLGTDPMTSRVAQELPEGRIVEGYLGTQSIYQMIEPFISMQTGVKPPVPAELPPVGFGVAAGDGVAHARLFIPAPVIEAGAAVGMSVQQGQKNFDQEDDDESGQPGF